MQQLKFLWQVDDSMAAQLAALIAKDADDWSSKRKLKLMSISRALCAVDVDVKIAISVSILTVVDAVLYAILGAIGRGPAFRRWWALSSR